MCAFGLHHNSCYLLGYDFPFRPPLDKNLS